MEVAIIVLEGEINRIKNEIETLKIYIKEDWKTIPNKTVNKDIEENKAEIKQLKKAIVILKEVDKKCII